MHITYVNNSGFDTFVGSAYLVGIHW